LKNKIRDKRRIVGYSQQELANMVGYQSKSSISMIEKGIKVPPLEKALLLAAALNSTLEELFTPNKE